MELAEPSLAQSGSAIGRRQIGEDVESPWRGLYRVGGVAALTMAAFIPIQIIIFILWPPPTTVSGWFALFQMSPVIGLLDMDLLLVIDQILVAMILLSLYVALKDRSQSLMAIALALGFLAIAGYFASATAFEMLTLSNQYTAATTDGERAAALSAGQAMVATWQGTAYDVGYVMEGMALLITSVAMLRSSIFGKRTAYVGLVLGVMSLVPATAGTVGLVLALGSLVPLEIWDLLVGRRLLQLR